MIGNFRSAYLETDASVDTHQEVTGAASRLFPAGAGIILRDITLRPMLLKSVPLGPVPGPFHAELLAFVRGLEEAAGLGVRGVWTTTDNLPLVNFVQNGQPRLTKDVRPIHGQLQAARARFGFVTLRWSRGSHRKVKFGGPSADALARAAIGLPKRK
jgi:ribonuclease HI